MCSALCTLAAAPLLLTAMAHTVSARAKRWALALDCSAIGAAQWDAGIGRVVLSARWLALLGYASQSFGTSASDVWRRIHEEDQPDLEDALTTLQRPGSDHCNARFRMQCHDGSWKWLDGHAVVDERAVTGQAARLLFTARDISELRAAEERYQLSAKLFQHLHEGPADHRRGPPGDGRNPTFSAITGYSRDELVGIVPTSAASRAHRLGRPAPAGRHPRQPAGQRRHGAARSRSAPQRRTLHHAGHRFRPCKSPAGRSIFTRSPSPT